MVYPRHPPALVHYAASGHDCRRYCYCWISFPVKKMTTPVININDYPQQVPVLIGAPSALVPERKLCGKYVKKRSEGYQVNAAIKTWSIFFLLKSLTTSGKIKYWTRQQHRLLTWCQCNENTFRRQLTAMQSLQLCTIDDDRCISLVSYEKAAAILGIEYTGTYNVQFNPFKYEGKQSFRFILTAEEFRSEQQRQLEALTFYLNKNPSLKNDLHHMLVKFGADNRQLQNPAYYQQRLLQLQMHLFREGSDILTIVFSRRADINRGVECIRQHHTYKSKSSVSYLKRKMHQCNVIAVMKVCTESKVRSRLYYKDGEVRKDSYKWIDRKKQTAWFLTDQVTFNYHADVPEKKKETTRRAA